MILISMVGLVFGVQAAQHTIPALPSAPTITAAICENPSKRMALIEELEKNWNSELRLSIARQRTDWLEEELIARIKAFARRANWSDEQERKFALTLYQNPRIALIMKEFFNLPVAMAELEKRIAAEADEVKNCHMLAELLELHSKAETYGERRAAALAALFEAEAKRLGIPAD